MSEALSLRVRLSLVAGAVLFGALLTGLGGTLLWLTDAVMGEQRASVRLLATEFERLLADHQAHRDEGPAASVLQQVIHSHWVRDPGLLRISLFAGDGIIVADTEPRQIGQQVPMHWRAGDSAARFREISDQAGQTTFVAALAIPGHALTYGAAFQTRPSNNHPDFRRAIHSLLGHWIPMLLVSVATLIGVCAIFSRLIIADLPLSHDQTRQRTGPWPAVSTSTDLLEHLPVTMRATIKTLEGAASDLVELASR